jgi:hypothetical protein
VASLNRRKPRWLFDAPVNDAFGRPTLSGHFRPVSSWKFEGCVTSFELHMDYVECSMSVRYDSKVKIDCDL